LCAQGLQPLVVTNIDSYGMATDQNAAAEVSKNTFRYPRIVFSPRYSDLSIFAGLTLAPLRISRPTVAIAIMVRMIVGTMNKSTAKGIRNAKPLSHSFKPYQVKGRPITLAISTSLKNCHDSKVMILGTEAPIPGSHVDPSYRHLEKLPRLDLLSDISYLVPPLSLRK
jgi:hypothetical protein